MRLKLILISLLWLTLLVFDRIAEMEKSLNDMNSKAMNHQKQLEHQIKELNLKYALCHTVRMYILAAYSYVCVYVRIFIINIYIYWAVKISNDCTSKLNEANRNHESVVAQRDSELKKYQEKYVHACVHNNVRM